MPTDERDLGAAREGPDGRCDRPPADRPATSPGRLLAILAGTLLAVEVGVMVALDLAGMGATPLGTLLDAVSLLALLAPVLYLTAYRPLRRLVQESRRAEQRARENEQRYRLLFENSLDPVFLTAPDGRVLEANPAAREAFGYTEEELRRLGRGGLLDPADPRLGDGLAERARTGRFRGELTFRHRDGRAVPVEVSSHVYRDAAGELRTSTVARDISRRRAVEEALAASEAKYRRLVETAHDLIWSVDAEGRITFINEAAREVYGREPAEMIGRRYTDFVLPGQAARNQEALGLALAGGDRVDRFENWVVHRDGTPVLLSANAVLLRNDRGEVAGSMGTSRDITAERHREEELARSRAWFAKVFHGSPIPMGVERLDSGEIVEVNERYAEFFDCAAAELVGRPAGELWAEPAERREVVRRIRDEGRVRDVEVAFRRRRGELRQGLLSMELLPGADQPLALAAVVDITERKRAEEALRHSEVLFRGLWEHMGTGVAVYEPAPDGTDFLILDLNRAGERTAQADREAVRGMRLLDAFPGARDLGLWDLLWQVLRTEEPGRLPATRYEDEHHAYWVENYVYRLPTGEVVAVFEDVTARREAEEALRERAVEIRRLGARLQAIEAEERRRLAAELHDQVGQTLTALGISLELLGTRLGPECAGGARRRLADCQRLVAEIGGRVRDVMGELRPQVLDDYGLRAALRWQCDVFSERHQIPCLVEGEEFAPRLPLEAETALFRVAQEALANAAKHARARRVEVVLEAAPGTCRLTVTDDGRGFAPAAPPADRSRRGWGLSLMQERAAAVGGAVRVESAPGAGTRVVAEVPR